MRITIGKSPGFVCAAVLLTALIIAGCARPERITHWQHSTKSEDQQAQDARSCRAYARRQVELHRGPVTDTDRLGTMPGGGSTYNEQVRNYDLSRVQSREFAACMRRLGYAAAR